MKRTLLTLALLAATCAVHAAPWTYNGTLNDGGKPANGQYDLRVTLLNETRTANMASPITFYSVNVIDGSFSVDVDFGIDMNTAPAMALGTEVQQGGSGFVSLGDPTQFDPKSMLGGVGVCWDTSGNAGTVPGDFLGTTDNQPLSIRANNSTAIRIEPSAELAANNRPITHNIIAGSGGNGVIAPARGATIAGGGSVNNEDPTYPTGGSNRVDDNYGTIGGGFDNQAGSSNASATDDAFATVSGGRLNSATGYASVINGGQGNIASGSYTTVSGGSFNCAGGDYSWVGGQYAKTRVGNGTDDGTCAPDSGDATGDEGTFVWADQSSSVDFVSSQPNQFLIRAANGVGINTNAVPTTTEMMIQALDNSVSLQLRTVTGKQTTISTFDTTGILAITTAPTAGTDRMQVFGGNGGPATLTNGGAWTNASSRSYKEHFSAVNGSDILTRLVALPIMTWDYIGSSEGLHMGPVAEDFKSSFGLAGDGKSISTVDADGIALAAIQGLNAKLESENGALRARLDALEARLQ